MFRQREQICAVCGRPMSLLDEENDRWYCYADDEVIINGIRVYWKGNSYRPITTARARENHTDDTRIFDEAGTLAVHCFYCGKRMPSDARFCRYCGKQQLVPD
jgi:hypothetical protein